MCRVVIQIFELQVWTGDRVYADAPAHNVSALQVALDKANAVEGYSALQVP